MLNHEKDPRVMDELLHEIGATKAVTPTGGTVSLSVAILRMGGTALLLFRCAEHQRVWEDHLTQWLRIGSSTNAKSSNYLSRAAIIRCLRLQPDGPESFPLVPAHVPDYAAADDAPDAQTHGDADAGDQEQDQEQDADIDEPSDEVEVLDPLENLFGPDDIDEPGGGDTEPKPKKKRRASTEPKTKVPKKRAKPKAKAAGEA